MLIRNISQRVQGSATDWISGARGASSPVLVADNANRADKVIDSVLFNDRVIIDDVPLNGDEVKRHNDVQGTDRSEMVEDLSQDERVHEDVLQCDSCDLNNEHGDADVNERGLKEDSKNHLSDEQFIDRISDEPIVFRTDELESLDRINGKQIDATSFNSYDIVESTNSRGVQINRRYRRERDNPSHISDVSLNEDGRHTKRDKIEFSKKFNFKDRDKGEMRVSSVSNLNDVDMTVNEISPHRHDVNKPEFDSQRKRKKIKKQDNRRPVKDNPEDPIAGQVGGIKQTSQNSIDAQTASDRMLSDGSMNTSPVHANQNRMQNDESTKPETHETQSTNAHFNSNKRSDSKKYYSTKPKKSIGDVPGKQMGNPNTLNVFSTEKDAKNSSAINETPVEADAVVDAAAVKTDLEASSKDAGASEVGGKNKLVTFF